MATPRYDIEAHSSTATLYLHTALTMDDIGELRIACSMLPQQVRRLRIDARAVQAADARTRGVLGEVVRYWRRTRGGGLELRVTERMLELAPPATLLSAASGARGVPDDAALSGMFL